MDHLSALAAVELLANIGWGTKCSKRHANHNTFERVRPMNATSATNASGEFEFSPEAFARLREEHSFVDCAVQSVRLKIADALEFAFAIKGTRDPGRRRSVLNRAELPLVALEGSSLPLPALDNDLATAQLANARFASSGRHKQAASNHEAAAQLHREAANLCEASKPELASERGDRAAASSQAAHLSSLAANPAHLPIKQVP